MSTDKDRTIARLTRRIVCLDIAAYLDEQLYKGGVEPVPQSTIREWIATIRRGEILPTPADSVQDGQGGHPGALPADLAAYPGGAIPAGAIDREAARHSAATAIPPMKRCGMCGGTGRQQSSPLHFCCSPGCPGYSWRASERPHPCLPGDVLSAVDGQGDPRNLPPCPACRGVGRIS